jgi:hypothetical protein
MRSRIPARYRRWSNGSAAGSAAHLSPKARSVKLADKIANLRDVADSPPVNWPLARRQEYFDWSGREVRRGHAPLTSAQRPHLAGQSLDQIHNQKKNYRANGGSEDSAN